MNIIYTKGEALYPFFYRAVFIWCGSPASFYALTTGDPLSHAGVFCVSFLNMPILNKVGIFNVFYCQYVACILSLVCGGHMLLGVLDVA